MNRQSGITLLELLVVIAVFSIMSAAAYSSLQSSLKAEENFGESMEELEARGYGQYLKLFK